MSTTLLKRTQPLARISTRGVFYWHAHVGPPHPVSNFRPVIYPRWPHPIGHLAQGTTKEGRKHPYSLEEFAGESVSYRWRLENETMDEFNHSFWLDSNSRFEIGKQRILSSLPKDISPKAREEALSQFYKQWSTEETKAQKDYAKEWRRKTQRELFLGARVWLWQYRAMWSKRLVLLFTQF